MIVDAFFLSWTVIYLIRVQHLDNWPSVDVVDGESSPPSQTMTVVCWYVGEFAPDGWAFSWQPVPALLGCNIVITLKI